MKLSVIILNYNVRYFLELCLQSVEKALQGLDAEIIVVDNKSTDTSCAMVKTKFPQVTLIENPTNSGFSHGNNIGVQHAKGTYVCILNPDTVVAEDTFKKLVSFADNQTNLGIVGCRLIDGTGNFLPESKRHVPTPVVALKKLLGFSNKYYVVETNELETAEVPIFVGAFMLLKKEVYLTVGGFDEAYFMYGEDIDLSYKIKKAGYASYYFGGTTVIHFKGESTLKDATYAKRFYGAMLIFYKKHFKSNVLFNALVWLAIRVASMMRFTNKTQPAAVKQRIIFTTQKTHKLLDFLEKPVAACSQLNAVKPFTEIILDAATVSYKVIFKEMERLKTVPGISFKIASQDAHFILGSQSSRSRGSVQVFKKN
ncbi:glycosyltransferase family 2 protein [Bizionia sediminis]|uniref:Glycosyltransferase family 2 protein n=1 Tax=Bizionia sediminis TaxID=1737064 RepID=A0ABW5KRH7_9FLAO